MFLLLPYFLGRFIVHPNRPCQVRSYDSLRVDDADDDDEGNDAGRSPMMMAGRALEAANTALLISNHIASSGSEAVRSANFP